jgi:hypothetical protein
MSQRSFGQLDFLQETINNFNMNINEASSDRIVHSGLYFIFELN